MTAMIARSILLSMLLAASAGPALGQERTEVQPVRASVPYPDPWFGEDKIQHFAASAGVTALAFGASRVAFDHPGATAAGIGVAALAGLLKEVHDQRIGRPFSLRDLAYDALGIGLAFLWIREIE